MTLEIICLWLLSNFTHIYNNDNNTNLKVGKKLHAKSIKNKNKTWSDNTLFALICLLALVFFLHTSSPKVDKKYNFNVNGYLKNTLNKELSLLQQQSDQAPTLPPIGSVRVNVLLFESEFNPETTTYSKSSTLFESNFQSVTPPLTDTNSLDFDFSHIPSSSKTLGTTDFSNFLTRQQSHERDSPSTSYCRRNRSNSPTNSLDMCIDRELNMDSDFGSLDVFGRSKDIMSSLFSELDGLEEEDKEDTTDFDYESTSYYQIPEESGGLNLDNYLDGLDLSAHSFDENAYDRKMAPRAMHIEPSNPKKRKHSVERKATKVRSIIKSRVLPNIGDMSLHPDYAIVEVISDSEDSEQGSSNNNEENCFDEKKKISRPNKDDLLCSDNNIPATASEIAEFSFSELKSFITENELTKEQNNIVKQIRRRGRNKVAARKTREQRQTQRPEKEDDDSNSNVSASPSSESTQSTSASIPKILPKKKFVPKIEFSDNLMKNSKPLYVIHNVPRIRIIKR